MSDSDPSPLLQKVRLLVVREQELREARQRLEAHRALSVQVLAVNQALASAPTPDDAWMGVVAALVRDSPVRVRGRRVQWLPRRGEGHSAG